jgi:hypothetical protein
MRDPLRDPLILILLSIPLLLNMLAVVFYRGFFRRAAMLLLPLMAGVSLSDLYSGALGGNLTGLLTSLFAGPLLLVILLLGIGSVFMGFAGPRKAKSESQSDRWAITGALVGLGGLMLVAPLSWLGRNTLAHRFLEWWSHQFWAIALGPIGVVLGALCGSGLSRFLGRVFPSRG